SWNDLDMELERKQRAFEQRVEKECREIRERLERVERCCKDAEDARRRDWEELKGRMMTADEERKHQSDGILRLMSKVTAEHLAISHSIGDELRQGFAESRAEGKAQSEAIMRILDRLPPPENS
ncbi:MAG TPA: hypothetical protein VGV69_00620, partial [Solirubrobacterales bacterium]|nr:hypothetical protein [Solirubrobacterales bacterium]